MCRSLLAGSMPLMDTPGTRSARSARYGHVVETPADCRHSAAAGATEPAFREAQRAAHRQVMVRVTCPDCWWELDVRCFRPESGEWYMYVRERLAAGRTWVYRRTGNRWLPGM